MPATIGAGPVTGTGTGTGTGAAWVARRRYSLRRRAIRAGYRIKSSATHLQLSCVEDRVAVGCACYVLLFSQIQLLVSSVHRFSFCIPF